MKGSIRWRLFAFAAVTILISLISAGGALVTILENHLLRRVAQDLDVRWAELARAFELDASAKPVLSREPSDPRYLQPYGGAYWQVEEDGKPVLRSRSLWDYEFKPQAQTEAAFEMDGPNASELYVVARPVAHDGGGDARRFVLSVALDHAEIADLRGAFAYDVAKVLAILVVVLAVGGAAQLHFGLQPFERLRASLARLREGRADRLDGAVPLEVAPLVEDLNRLLDKQDRLIEKARSRAGSLAHGLKTPMTILAGEIRRLEERGETEAAAALREPAEAIRLHVERELAKARTHGAVRSSVGATGARRMIDGLIDLMRKIDVEERIAWRVEVPANVTVRMEAGDFAEIVGNLLDNARKWARSEVRVSYEMREGRPWLAIEDDGPGVDAALRGHVLDRGVHSAHAPDGSTGLGFSIVAEALEEYGLTMAIEERPAGGCRISFPLERAAPERERRPAPAPLAESRVSPAVPAYAKATDRN